MFGRSVTKLYLVDIFRLAEGSTASSESVIKAGFDWEHSRRVEVAKWLMATGAAAIIADFALMARSELPPHELLIALPTAGGFLAFTGYLALRRAAALHDRYLQTAILLSRMAEIKPFLTRLRRAGLL